MENKTWKFEVHLHSDKEPLSKTFRFEVNADEREAYILMDVLILGAELSDISVGGGLVVAENE